MQNHETSILPQWKTLGRMTQNRGNLQLCKNSHVLCGLNVDLPENSNKNHLVLHGGWVATVSIANL